MSKLSKILMLVNWDVHHTNGKNDTLQSPNRIKEKEKYWFFKHWPDQNVRVDVLDFCKLPLVNHIERWWLKFYVIQTLKAWPKLKRYDLIISHGAQSGVLLAFLRSLLGKKMPPHIIIDVGCFNGGRNRKLELLPLRCAIKSVAGVVSHNSFQKDYYRRNLPGLAERNFFVPFGADSEFFKPLDLKTNNYIVSVGYVKRDWDTLLKAFEGLENDVTLKIIGVPEKKKLNIPPEIQNRVECLPYTPILKLKEEIAKARFMVIPLPYVRYSLGQTTLLQAMSMQKAVIVTDVPAIADYVKDGETAHLFQAGDWKNLKEKMQMLLEDSKLTQRVARKAREAITNEFNEKNLALNLYQAVGRLCQKKM
jgi:glycosyltransferase involved in cell wall biosynthesis